MLTCIKIINVFLHTNMEFLCVMCEYECHGCVQHFVHTQWNTWNQTTSLQQNKKWSAPSTTASWNWSSMVNASAILAQNSKNHEPWMLLPSLPKKLTCLVQLKLTLMPVRTNNCTRDTMRFREQKSHAKCANMKLVRVWNVSSLMTGTYHHSWQLPRVVYL